MITTGPLRPDDRPRWQELFEGYNTFYGRVLADAVYERAWARFQDGVVMHALGARDDGELVGIAHFLVHPSTTAADSCYLQDLFTDPEARGRGAGRALIAAVAQQAQSRGCARVYWTTHESNAGARRLYDQIAVHRGFLRYDLDLAGSR